MKQNREVMTCIENSMFISDKKETKKVRGDASEERPPFKPRSSIGAISRKGVTFLLSVSHNKFYEVKAAHRPSARNGDEIVATVRANQ
jgi:hypothetical protein